MLQKLAHSRTSLPLFLVLLLYFALSTAWADEAAVPANGGFEQSGTQPTGWTTQGDVSIDRVDAFKGTGALLLTVDPLKLIPTSALSTSFDVKGKELEVAGATRSDLYFQDLSFDGSLFIRFLDASGKEVGNSGFLSVHGKTAWQAFLKRVPIPAGAVKAQIGVQIDKTHGKLWVDALTAKSVAGAGGAAGLTYFSSSRLANMFYPGDYLAFQVELDTDSPINDKGRRVTCTITDYWGVPQHAPLSLTLQPTKPRNAKKSNGYAAWLDLHNVSLKAGKYYELRTEQNLGGAELYRANTSFAILPEPQSKNYNADDIPFGAHTWNATMSEYFFMASRLGTRRCLVFWDWPDKPPYTPDFTGRDYDVRIGYPKKLGMRPFGQLYPASEVEHEEKPRSEEDLRSGIRQSIQKYVPDGLWGFAMGNEPPSWDPAKVQRNVGIYKILYDEAKKTDPNIFMISSSVSANEDYFKLGFGKYCDAYSFHCYGSLSELRINMQRYKDLFAKYGDPKPIFGTEIGSKGEGLSRHEIADDLVRKAVCFLADGGRYFTWFAITYPDFDGNSRDTYSDAMNMIDGYLGMYAPRLDAIAYYQIINTMLDKKFVKESESPDGTSSFLFQNNKLESLMVVWNTNKTLDSFVSLPGVHAVRLVHIDGSEQQLDAGGGGITLHITDEPQLLVYSEPSASAGGMPFNNKPLISLLSLPETVTQGQIAKITARVDREQKGDVDFIAPPGWKSSRVSENTDADGGRLVTFSLEVPADSKALEATCDVLLRKGDAAPSAQLEFRLPIASSIQVDFRPLAVDVGQDLGRIQLTVSNHGRDTQDIDWNVEIQNEYPMTEGHFDFQAPSPVQAHFTDLPEGKMSLKPGEEKQIVLNLAQVDRLNIYRMQAQARDVTGKSVIRQRLFSGFVGVPKAKGPITIDGNFNEADWSKSPVIEIKELRQFFKAEAPAKWHGPDDLSGKLRFLWDDKYLYVGVEVTDDIFAANVKDDRLWAGDGLQFLIDPVREKPVKKGPYDISLGLGLKGPQAWCHQSADVHRPEGEITNMGLGIKRLDPKNGNMNYEIAIPWEDITPFQPGVGHDLGLSMIINEDDGPGRFGFIGWFSGVHLKELDHVGDLILQP